MNNKPRNRLVAAARFRRAGHHGKSSKALRRADTTALIRLLKKTSQDGFEFLCQWR